LEGCDPQTDKRIIISTWQSLMDQEPEYFEQYKLGIGDEVHGFKAKSLIAIMTALTNAYHRFGFTGTLSNDVAVHELVIEGLFGPIIRGQSTEELIEQEYLANLNIICIVLEYPESKRKIMKGMSYADETDFIVADAARQRYIKNLALSLKGSTFLLCRLIDKHARILFDQVSASKRDNTRLVYGGTTVDDREITRQLSNINDEMSVVASYGIFSGGVNIPNLKNVVFASPYRSKIKVLQSIGRVLRRTKDKISATVIDIIDDLSIGNHKNYSVKHFHDRMRIYNKTFPNQNLKIIRVKLNER
jgi:superfamily II DNA or RNA helicase